MTRPLALGLVLLATAAGAADLATATRHLEPSRVGPSRKAQWAPSGNFQALHARAVFRGETGSAARPYGRARGETAAGLGVFLSRDSYEGKLNSAPSLHRFAYGNFNPLRYSDATGHDVGQAENAEREDDVIAATEKAKVQGAPTGQVNAATGAIERTAPVGSDDQAIYATLLKGSWKRKGVPVELLAGPKFVERKVIESKTLGTVLPLVSNQEQLSAILSGMSAADPPFSKTQSAIASGQSRLEQLGAPGYETRFFGEMAKSRDAMLTGYWAIGLAGSLGVAAAGAGEELAAIGEERAAAANAKVTTEAVENHAIRDSIEAAKNKPTLFENLVPEDAPRGANVIPNEMLSRISGKFAYVVTDEGELVVGRSNMEQGHVDLARGRPVQAAGEVKVVKGDVRFIDNWSGHYRPSGPSAQQAAESAFEEAGFDPAGKYIERKFK